MENGMVYQYIQSQRIAHDFSIYYDIYSKYRTEYQVEAILTGH